MNPKEVEGNNKEHKSMKLKTEKKKKKINKTKSWFLKKVNKIDKPLTWLKTTKVIEKAHITNTRNEKWDIITNPVDIKEIRDTINNSTHT